MNLKTVTIADLEPHPDNPNTHPAKQVDALAKSLTEFTQIKNVVIWNNRIIAGHGVIEAAKKAGLLTLEAQDISHWPEAKATAFMLADIRLPDMAIVNEEAMAETLRAIEQPLDIPGFDEDFLAGLGGKPIIPELKNNKPPTLESDHLIQIYCSKEWLLEHELILNEWADKLDVTIDIS
jgi:hypothetical protein